MTTLERKIELLIALALAEDEDTRKEAKAALVSIASCEDETAVAKTQPIERVVENMLTEIGIPCSLSGYEYLVSAICMMADKPDLRYGITSRLYPEVAKKASAKTTGYRVERAMRHAIEVAWSRGDCDVLDKYFGNTICPIKGKPTNSEFICQLAKILRNETEE